jgi:hypothetical protein
MNSAAPAKFIAGVFNLIASVFAGVTEWRQGLKKAERMPLAGGYAKRLIHSRVILS